MAVYIPAKFAGMYAYRTICNYEIIKKVRQNNNKHNTNKDEEQVEASEVTQLINSLFGLVILPFEKFKFRRGQGLNQDGSENNLRKYAQEEYWKIRGEIEEYKNHKQIYSNCDDRHIQVSHLIKHIRNSLAHSGDKGIHFWPFDNGLEITHVYFYDEDQYDENKKFALKLTVEQIETLCDLIMKLYTIIEEKSKVSYLMDIRDIDELLLMGVAP